MLARGTRKLGLALDVDGGRGTRCEKLLVFLIVQRDERLAQPGLLILTRVDRSEPIITVVLQVIAAIVGDILPLADIMAVAHLEQIPRRKVLWGRYRGAGRHDELVSVQVCSVPFF